MQLLVAVALLAGVAEGAPSAGAAPTVSFSATASAETVQIALESAALPIATTYDIGMPGAQAVLDSLGQSRAYAAAPYPSETLVTVPGLLASLGVPLIPPYPLIVRTEAPLKSDDEIAQGPLLLRVHSDAAASEGFGQISAAQGVNGASASATVQTDIDASPVVATGDSRFDGLTLADGLLAVGRVHTVAEARVDPDGKVVVSSHLDITALSIAGINVGLGEHGLEVGGNLLVPIPLAQLNALLKGAGVQLEYLAPVVDPDGLGITAGGLRITTVVQGLLQAPLTVTQTIGRARARLDAAVAPAAAPPPSVAVAPPAPPPTVGAVTGQRPSLPVSVPPVATPSVAAPAAPAPSVQAVPTGTAIAQFGLISFYLVLVAAGAVLGGCGRLFRYVGVQRLWT